MDAPAPLEMTAAPKPARTGLLLTVLVIVAAGLRVPLMGESIWFDEACMSDQRIGTFGQLAATIYVDIHPPLFIAFMHVWNGLFGDGEWSMRLPALLLGLGSIPLLYHCGRRLAGDTAALWAAALLALSPAHVWYSVEARLYSPMVFFTLLSVWTFDRLITGEESRRRGLWLLHLLVLAVMLALHYYLSLYVVLLAGIAPLVARRLSRTALNIWIAHGAGLVLLAGFVFVKQQLGEFETSQDYLRALTPESLYALFFVWCWTGNTLHPFDAPAALLGWLPQGLAIALCVLGFTRLLNRQKKYPLGVWMPALALTIPGFLVISAWAGLGSTYIERSCLPSLPFFLLLVGSGIAWLPRRVRPFAGGLALLVAAASLFAMFSFRSEHWTVYKPNPDWRAAARWLGEEIDRGGAGRPVFTSMPNPRPLPYYDSRIQDVKTLVPPMAPDEIRRKVAGRLGGFFGDLAGGLFEDFVAHNRELLEGSRLRIYRCAADPGELRLDERSPAGDDVCYLVQNHWHPPPEVDNSVVELLRHERVSLIERQQFEGITVYKVRIAR